MLNLKKPFYLYKVLQLRCKVKAEASSLGLRRAAARSRHCIFIAFAKVRIFHQTCNYFNMVNTLISPFCNLLKLNVNYLTICLVISEFICTFAPMKRTIKTYGRMELAQLYFPAIAPRSAWRRMKDLLSESPSTAELALHSRRVFMPAEVSLIFKTFGEP